MQPQFSGTERRRHPRTISHTTAVVKVGQQYMEYTVRNLSVGGALLTNGPVLEDGSIVEIVLHIPLYPPIRVHARVVHQVDTRDGTKCTGVSLLHATDVTEDHIQSALLSELERARARTTAPPDAEQLAAEP